MFVCWGTQHTSRTRRATRGPLALEPRDVRPGPGMALFVGKGSAWLKCSQSLFAVDWSTSSIVLYEYCSVGFLFVWRHNVLSTRHCIFLARADPDTGFRRGLVARGKGQEYSISRFFVSLHAMCFLCMCTAFSFWIFYIWRVTPPIVFPLQVRSDRPSACTVTDSKHQFFFLSIVPVPLLREPRVDLALLYCRLKHQCPAWLVPFLSSGTPYRVASFWCFPDPQPGCGVSPQCMKVKCKCNAFCEHSHLLSQSHCLRLTIQYDEYYPANSRESAPTSEHQQQPPPPK